MKFKTILITLIVAVMLCATAHAQSNQVFDLEGDALAYEKITATTASVGFTAAKVTLDQGTGLKYAKAALITVETAAVRFTLDGTTPVVTATSNGTGHLMNAGDSYVIRGWGNIQRFRAINAVASSGSIIFCTFFY